jgi:hypothetical protein
VLPPLPDHLPSPGRLPSPAPAPTPSPEVGARALQPARRLHVCLGAVKGYTATATPATGGGRATKAQPDVVVLLLDWEALVLLCPDNDAAGKNATCRFHGGASSPARALGRLPGPGSSAAARTPASCPSRRAGTRRSPLRSSFLPPRRGRRRTWVQPPAVVPCGRGARCRGQRHAKAHCRGRAP